MLPIGHRGIIADLGSDAARVVLMRSLRPAGD